MYLVRPLNRYKPGDFKCGSFVHNISQLVTGFNNQHHTSTYYVVQLHVWIQGTQS